MALKGLKVIEMGGLAPAPFCGMLLGDFGATVIRVDKLGANLDFDCLTNGKKSLALNLKEKKGVKILRKLCASSDVLIDPYRKGVMEKLGLGPQVLLADNPRLVYARLTGFGQSGMYSDRAGHDINYIAVSGILSLFGRKDEKPTAPVNLAADFGGGGLMCALGIVLALLERSSSGVGQVVDANMVEGSAYLSSWLFRSQSLPIWGQPRGHNILDTGSHFYDTYKTKDGKYMAVGALEPQFYAELLNGLGLSHEDLPQYGGEVETKREILEQKFQEKTQAEWCSVFDGLDACVTPVLSLDEAPTHPHNASRKSFIKGDTPIPQVAPHLERTPGASRGQHPKPLFGQHTAEILTDLQYTAEEIQALEREGVIESSVKSKL